MSIDTEIESEFITKLKELKKKRNNHLIDEPDFDEAVEQLAADTYAHNSAEGWCCACEADQAFMESEILQQVTKGIESLTLDATGRILTFPVEAKWGKNRQYGYKEGLDTARAIIQRLSNEALQALQGGKK